MHDGNKMQYGILSHLSGLLPLKYELAGRCSQFINKCMISECDIVTFVVRRGIIFFRMYSPIGRNACYCTSGFGLKLEDICCIDKHLIRPYVEAEYSDNLTHYVVSLLEMLFINFNYHLLSLFTRIEHSKLQIKCVKKQCSESHIVVYKASKTAFLQKSNCR